MKTLLSNLAVFMPQQMGKNFAKIKDAYIYVIKQALLEKLNEDQKKLFEIVSYHSWDPNYPENGKNMDLLEFLIFECLGGIATTEYEHWFSVKTNFNEDGCKKLAGVGLDEFKEKLKSVKRSWRHVADIEVSENHELYFRLTMRETFYAMNKVDHFRAGLKDRESGKYDGNEQKFKSHVKLLESTFPELAIAYTKGYEAFPNQYPDDTVTDGIIFEMLKT